MRQFDLVKELLTAPALLKPGGRQAEISDGEVLAGLVERVTFHNLENGFCVLRTKARGHRDLVTTSARSHGVAGRVDYGMGEWNNDRQVSSKARFLRISAPSSVESRNTSGRDDPGHRPGLCPQAGPGVRREGL